MVGITHDGGMAEVDVESLVSHEIPLEEIALQGFERLETLGSEAVKILVRIGGER